MDSRHGDPISIGKMYWKRLRTGLWDAGLVEPMEQALKHVYGPDMCIATDRVERILSECGRGLDDLDMLADVAAASALIAYVLETNEGALGEYAETARRVTAKRDAAREAVRMKRDEFAAEQHARIAELDQLMHS
jgi:hypothetical protein